MRRYAFIGFVAVAFVVMTAAVLLRATSGQEQQRGGWGGRETPVAVHTVAMAEFTDVVEALGTARANESVTITAKVSDVIARLDFDSGQQVEAGEILVELADAEEAAGLTEARATLRETSRDVERIRDLTERGVAPRSRLDEAFAANERARARVEAIEARVADRIIRAPFSGVIGLRNVSAGELVRPGDVIAQLDDSSIIKLDFTIPERFLSVVERGQEVAARSSAFPDTEFSGEVEQIDSRVDPATRAVTVRALIENADGRLRPGMLMTVELRRDRRSMPAIPGGAVVRLNEQAFVFRIEDTERGTTVSRTPVELGRRTSGLIEVLSGLQAGDSIVPEGVHRLSDGAPVSIPSAQSSDDRTPSGGSTAVSAAN
jgi:membrane fusion protein (multidrug efflux system)